MRSKRLQIMNSWVRICRFLCPKIHLYLVKLKYQCVIIDKNVIFNKKTELSNNDKGKTNEPEYNSKLDWKKSTP